LDLPRDERRIHRSDLTREAQMLKRLTILTAGLLLLLLAPASAGAAPGWELPQISSFVRDNPQLPNTNYAQRCGASQFGVYRFAVGVTVRGRQGSFRFSVRISADGRGHRARKVRVTGHVPRQLRRETRRLLRDVTFRYVAGSAPLVETVYPDGTVQASRPFNPTARRCSR
jgi:hypothetical protein